MNSLFTYTYILVSIIVVLLILETISPYKFTHIENVIMTLCIFIPSAILYNINKNLSTLPIYTIPIFFLYSKSKRLLRSILFQLVCYLIIILSDNFIAYIILNTCGINFIESSVGYIVTCILIFVFAYIISKLFSTFLSKYDNFISQYAKSKYAVLIYIMLFLTFIVFYININWNNSNSPTYLAKTNGFLFLIYGMLMIIISATLFFILKKEQDFKLKEIQLKNLSEYTNNLENLYMDMRKFRHDYINILSSMAGFIEDRDIDGLEEHFNEHIYPLNKRMNKNNYKLGLLKNILMPEIKGLVSAKVIRAQELGINVVLEILEPIDKINLDIIDLSRCLGILLDNAIEAALDSTEKNLNIAFIKKNMSILIVISNSFYDEKIVLSKIFKSGFSTKGKNRGLGLSNLKDILNKYQNASLDTSIDDNIFTQNITITNS